MKYLVGGYTMLNDFVLPNNDYLENVLGGSVFSAAGIKLWRDELVYIGVAGNDFNLTYGQFFEDNNIATDIRYSLPTTLHYKLEYGESGQWTEEALPGKGFAESERPKTWILPEQFIRYCDEETLGIYVEAALNTQIVNHFADLKKAMPNGKLMWEVDTQDLMDSSKKEQILDRIKQVDIYSLNWNEAKVFFQVESKNQAIKQIQQLGKPCFFRDGKAGSWLIQKDGVVFEPALGVENSIDPTGCGNNSTEIGRAHV